VAGVDRPVGVEPFFHGAVIGADDHRQARPGRGLDNPAQIPVHRLDGLQDGRLVLDVPDDIHIREIGENEGIRVIPDRVQDRVGDRRDRHFRGLVEEGDILTGCDDTARFPVEGFVPFAVQEESDVHRLFRLRDLDLFQAMAGDGFAQGVGDDRVRRKGDLHPEVLPVADHRGEVKREVRVNGEFRKTGFGETARQFDLPLSPNVVEDDGVAALEASDRVSPFIDQNERFQGFIFAPGPVALAYGP